MGVGGYFVRFRVVIRIFFSFELCPPRAIRATGKLKDDNIDQRVYLTPIDIREAHGDRLASDSVMARHIGFFDFMAWDWIRKFLPEPKRKKKSNSRLCTPDNRLKLDLLHAHKRGAQVAVRSEQFYCCCRS